MQCPHIRRAHAGSTEFLCAGSRILCYIRSLFKQPDSNLDSFTFSFFDIQQLADLPKVLEVWDPRYEQHFLHLKNKRVLSL